MERSMDRILTTHVGALQRPVELSQAMAEQGEWAPEVVQLLRGAVQEVVRCQVDTGIDVVDDGETLCGMCVIGWMALRPRLVGGG